MFNNHFKFWPKRTAKTLTVPKTNLYYNLQVSADRYPEKTAINYYDSLISYRQMLDEVNKVAGFMQKKLGITKGDRVLLYMQNCPHFIIAYYAILRIDAVVVPINAMNVTEEVEFYLKDSEAKLAIVAQELVERIEPLMKCSSVSHVIALSYSDYIVADTDIELPDEVAMPTKDLGTSNVTIWWDILSAKEIEPDPSDWDQECISLLPYTSGTTGRPKGCIHKTKSIFTNTLASAIWQNITSDSIVLSTLPLYHLTGMQHQMNAPIFSGSTIILLARWDRDVAGEMIQRYGCSHWVNISTMLIDFLSNPRLSDYNLESLEFVGGGGATLPKAIGEKLYNLTGNNYVEGYGLTESAAQTHFNPPDRPKLQCMGIPSFDTDTLIVDAETLEDLGEGQEGEILVAGPQLFKGYWNRPQETKRSFVTIRGKTYFRTGDIGKYDEDGYFFIVDRAKRMINASGFKVWPMEVENKLYKHPAIESVCVIGVPDERRGETTKAYVVLSENEKGEVTEEEIIEWSKQQMSAYKYPRIVEFVDHLPLSASGKILWRVLQEQENKKANKN
jgi:fatty-acyl-CoA synthase